MKSRKYEDIKENEEKTIKKRKLENNNIHSASTNKITSKKRTKNKLVNIMILSNKKTKNEY